jgi:hypothetical protein
VKRCDVSWNKLLLWIILSAALIAFLEGLRLMVKAPFTWNGLATRWMFVAVMLFTAQWTQPYSVGGPRYIWPWPGVLAAGVGVGVGLIYGLNRATWAAWVVAAVWYLLLLGLSRVFSAGLGVQGLLALAGGAVPVAIVQLESRFANEEFFAALQVLALGLFWMLLSAAQRQLSKWGSMPERRGLCLDRRWPILTLILLTSAGLWGTVRAYQCSFYPSQSPAYEGISSQTPFLCGEASPDSHTFDGKEVFRRLLARVEANPCKGPPEYGMLALGAGEQHWAQAFRKSLLDEAAEGHFTGPAHSVKAMQYEAALRAYYFSRVHSAFPTLFSGKDVALLQEWFAVINRRALTVEWVDWMYALAFAKRPEGPYENQENGAGLLALLESEGLTTPDLSPANRDYLRRNRRGWVARFRNTDDAFIYQPEWINNAYFQSLYTGETREENVRLSFEWLLLQSLPGGAPLGYNHPAYPSLAGIAYLGAHLLEDSHYVWLAGQTLSEIGEVEAREKYLFAQPGVEESISLTGRSPTQGSCLLYGDSGLPNQTGPLAPDKIVFRDGWSSDSAYLLLNLRFTGWHRYKASNTITLVYQNGPLAADVLDGKPFTWLPVGRSVFRDKRVPRENLNGLLVERSGMSAVLYALTSVGGPWAQDPPHYAEVVAFETGDELDWSHTRLVDWRGWQHDRWVYFYHGGGPIIVVDGAEGPPGDQAALVWHLVGKGVVEDRRIRLRDGDDPVEIVLMPVGPDGRVEVAESEGGDSRLCIVYYALPDGRLRLVTLFLPGWWAGAEISWEREERALWVAQGEEHIVLMLPDEL